MYITTKADFKEFRAEVEFWVKIFGLHDFYIEVQHDQTSDTDLATTYFVLEGKHALITLQKNWGADPPYKDQIKRTAFHEVAEILLSSLWLLACKREFSEDEIERERHAIINRLDHGLWKQMRRRTRQ